MDLSHEDIHTFRPSQCIAVCAGTESIICHHLHYKHKQRVRAREAGQTFDMDLLGPA